MMSASKWEPIATVYDPLKAGSIDGTDTTPHDHGIVRAMKAEYKPNQLVSGDPRATVFVGRLNPQTTEATLKETFSSCGDIKKLRLIRDIVTGFSRGYAFIEFYDQYDAKKAIRNFNHTVIDSKEVLVDGECERLLPGWIPRRLGGGLSGKKESGQLRFGGKERPFKKPLNVQKKEENKSNDSNKYSESSDYGWNSKRNYYDRSFRRGHHDRHSRNDNFGRHSRNDYGRHSRNDDSDRHSRNDDYDRYSRNDGPDRHSRNDDYETHSRNYDSDRHSRNDDYDRYSRNDGPDRYSRNDDYETHSRNYDSDRHSRNDDYEKHPGNDDSGQHPRNDDY